ncbi:MAG: hypothetical protein AB198_02360 [Parcubacteria bacterium C7867-003]|nr:MAG: hypothetical protein AB198_02360 [Parcubacteria bacterium C7867-003]
MADAKKPDDKSSGSSDPVGDFIWILFALFIFMYAINGLIAFFGQSKIFSNGFSGFTQKGLTLLYTNPISSLDNPLNTKFIVTNKEANLYDSPGGRKIDTKHFGDKGTIVGGPVSIGDDKYWRVRFEDGSEGWISESDIASIEGVSPNIFIRTGLLIWKIIFNLKLILILISIILILLLAYLSRGIFKLRTAEGEKLYPAGIPEEFNEPKISNPIWEKIENNLSSSNENDWRQAIIEADVILDELLDKLSLPGETMGDKLRSVERADFTTIDFAWEAHKIRNQIAHEGSAFALSQREAKRVIELYRVVFEEFGIVEKQ